MRKYELLNIASDLRRIARWVGENEVHKFNLVNRLYNEAKKDKLASQIMNDSRVVIKNDLFKDKESRIWFAEQSLMASLRLTNLAMEM